MLPNKLTHLQLIDKFKQIIPKLVSDLHKGQCGRIGVIGGSKEYTGAPYYAGISALRSGADLCYVIASKDAAPVIKSYSPELIVYPLIDEDHNESEISNVISKIHSLVIGPGLGRSDLAWTYAKAALLCAKSQNIPIILDADALIMIQYDPELVSGYKKCILTPNVIEFKRLYEQVMNDKYEESPDLTIEDQCKAVQRLAAKLNNLTILKKGQIDVISDGVEVIYNEIVGSNRRCGGQGDMVCGVLGTFAYWANRFGSEHGPSSMNPNLLAAYSATTLTKTCSRCVFEKMHRSMLTTDMIQHLPEIFHHLFDS